jgi:hypothetical protein
MGKAAELLVAAACILISRGELNASTSFVDDEGVDLVFHRRGRPTTLAVQVKSRTSDTVRVKDGGFMAFVRSATFTPRADLDMLFVAVDVDAGSLMTAWLVPSVEGNMTSNGTYRFRASLKPDTQDQWRPWRLTPAQLPGAVLRRLTELDASPV